MWKMTWLLLNCDKIETNDLHIVWHDELGAGHYNSWRDPYSSWRDPYSSWRDHYSSWRDHYSS